MSHRDARDVLSHSAKISNYRIASQVNSPPQVILMAFRGARGGGRGGSVRGAAGGRGAPRGGGRGGMPSRGGRGGGRGAPRGGRGAKPSRGGARARGGAKVVLEPHRHPGVFIAKSKDHLLVTKNLVPGESVYGEKRITIEGGVDDTKVEYRVWNPFRSKLAAGVLGGMDDIFIAPGKKVLYLGAASGTSVSHVADIVGPVSLLCLREWRIDRFLMLQEGVVYAVEFSPRSGRDLINMAKKRTNVIRTFTRVLLEEVFLCAAFQLSSRTLVYPTNIAC